MKQDLEKIKTKHELINFLQELKIDSIKNPDQWENQTIDAYLDSIISWLTVMEQSYVNNGKTLPQDVNWEFIALLLYIRKIYE